MRKIKQIKINYKELTKKLREKLLAVINEVEVITLSSGTYGHGYNYVDGYGNVQMGVCWHPFVEVYADKEKIFEFEVGCDEYVEEGIEEMPFFEEIIDVLETVYGVSIFFDDNGDLYIAEEFESEDRVYISISGDFHSTDLHYGYTDIDVQKIREYVKSKH